ncbi:MmgE/PrpD family protein [Azohydromonas australica]|uniref:MmgE/PrpD family protein n=1 Tax=Azohydromonas australica TaxID=364039 RepID=UPI00048F5737|nr:MmgE/PrpD family protein [Azohydromonas australica]
MSHTPTPDQPSSPDLAIDLARFAARIDASRLDDTVVKAVKTNILDTLSCALAGSSAKAISEIRGLVEEWAGTPQADMFVFGGRFPAHHAAFVNGGMSHARDYDDTHDAAILHAGVTAVPAAIAAGQLRGGLSGAELVAAVAAGLEVTCRLGIATEVDIVESGFIYTSLLGYFGATAAAGRALGLDEAQMLNAFGIVYSSVAGNHQVTRDASLMKRLQPGLAAQAAVLAVQLAQRGIRGAQHVFEGADGFIRVYLHGRVDPAIVRKDLGQRFELLNLSYKPYPCCRDTHAAVDAALKLRTKTQRSPDDIESIRVGVTGPGYQMVCVPEQVRLAPRTIVEAQFSIPYTVAAAWVDGQLGMKHFSDEGLQRTDILALAKRVQPYVDDEIDRDWHRFVTPARMIVRFRDGTTVEERIDYPKGHPNNPMSDAEFAAKSADCATFTARPLASDVAVRLTETVRRLESLGDIAELVRAMT